MEFLWVLMNAALLVWIIVLCVRAIKLMNREYGRLSAVVLTIGLLLLTVGQIPDSQKEEERIGTTTEVQLSEVLNLSAIHHIFFSISTDMDNDIYKCRGRIGTNGLFFISGPISWKTVGCHVNKVAGGYSYSILGIEEWNVLTLTVFRRTKRFEGIIPEFAPSSGLIP